MTFTDTGLNFPETEATLLAQQEQLLKGKRLAQMFPSKTDELDLPDDYARVETDRGIFHFNPAVIHAGTIKLISDIERKNILLGLGPYNKVDVVKLVLAGEEPLVVTERTPEGVEVKAAVGTKTTVPLQIAEFNRLKSENSKIATETVNEVLLWRRKNTHG